MKPFSRAGVSCVCLLVGIAAVAGAQKRPEIERPGVERGATLLPNGWKIKPAGRHMNVGDLPLAVVESADGRYLIVTDNGYVQPALTVVDLKNFTVARKVPLEKACPGLAWSAGGTTVYFSGAAANTVEEFRYGHWEVL